ncbi:MAG: leucine-rich repeat domain-containing protein [Alistipes sp.]|nr:leucine-rich repeat domain-containing protein [Alistipes sp.]
MKRLFTILMMTAMVAVSCEKGGEDTPTTPTTPPAGGEVVPPAPVGPQTKFTSSQGAGGTVVLRFNTNSKPEGVEGAEQSKSTIAGSETIITYTLTDSTFAVLGEVERIVIEDETITAIDTSLNPALKNLDCQNNEGLISLDLSSNANLTNLKAQNCGLTSLLVSNEAEDISNINLFNNNISGAAMTAFVESLPTVLVLGYIQLSNDDNGNIATDSDLKIAASKNFEIYYQGAWVKKSDLSIDFADSEVKRLCVENWDTDGNGELSYSEAAEVTELSGYYEDRVFEYTNITSFDELQYFTALKTIGQYSFYGCRKLTSITLPQSVTTIGEFAFCATGISSITIPDSVESIGYGICGQCHNLSAIYGKFATDDNRCLIVDGVLNSVAPADLTEFVIPSGVTEIGALTFNKLTNFTSITIPESVSKINNCAFEDCSSLTSITIPDSVESIGIYIFRGCHNLSAIYGKFASDDNRCLIVDGVLNAIAPAGLTEYVIPSGVTEISDYTFYELTNFTSITIPESVSKINYYAFGFCSSLTSVYCRPTTPPAGDYGLFQSNASNRKIYVPTASVEAYKSAEYWSDYADAIVGYDF